MACHSQWQNPRQMKSAWTLQRNDSDKTWNLEDIRSHWRYFSWRSTNFLRTLFAQQASKMTSGPGSLIRWKWRICQQHVEGRNWQQQSTHIQTSNIQQLTTLRNSTNAQTNRINTHTHTLTTKQTWKFSDPNLTIWARKLRKSLAQLHKLCKNPGSRCAHA